VPLAWTAFFVGAIISLTTSWFLVTRLERLGERIGLSEALLGMVAALAADAPEITSSVTAVIHHQRTIGAGVVIGSNVFNLAALLGLGAVVSGYVVLHRRVVLLGGAVALWVALAACLTMTGVVAVPVGLALVATALAIYGVVLGLRRAQLHRLPLPRRAATWLAVAVHEEEVELELAIRPPRGRPVDAVVALVSLVVVVSASAVMEVAASRLGHHFHVADAVTGGVDLAIVTSLPNAVAALYLARRRRGAAALSTALNSNNLNVLAGLLVPGVIVGATAPSLTGNITALWYLGLTLAVLALAYASRGLRRWQGALVIGAYLAYVAVLVGVA